MNKQANKTAIGVFIIGAIILFTCGIVIFGSGHLFARQNTYVLYFKNAVNGLNVGSAVVFRGVKVGSVKSIAVRANPMDLTFTIPVFIDIDDKKFSIRGCDTMELSPEEIMEKQIKRGLRAELRMQSIVTGQLMVSLDFHPDKPAILTNLDPDYIEIPTVSSGIQELAKKIEKAPVEEIFNKLLAAVKGIEEIVNSPKARDIITSLDDASNGLNQIIAKVDRKIDPLVSEMDLTLKTARMMLKKIDTKIDPLVHNFSKTMTDIGTLAQNIDSSVKPIAINLKAAVKTADATMIRMQASLQNIDNMTGDNSPVIYKFNTALEEVSSTADSLRALINYLERHPESLLWGKKDYAK